LILFQEIYKNIPKY